MTAANENDVLNIVVPAWLKSEISKLAQKSLQSNSSYIRGLLLEHIESIKTKPNSDQGTQT